MKVPVSDKGDFIRPESAFRSWVTDRGSGDFRAAAGRYHLYVSLGCPWAGRVLIGRSLKGLTAAIGVTFTHWLLSDESWKFEKPDPINGKSRIREIYKKANPKYEGRTSVPVLWDKEKQTIVNNESSEILRMLGTVFNSYCATPEQSKLDFYPTPLQKHIDDLNDWIYPMINNGVYRAGFATSQEAYTGAVNDVFNGLDRVESILSKRRYLTGDQVTEADIRLFTTLIRFDPVYASLFKCTKKRLVDYPNIWGYTRDIYQLPGVSDTTDIDHITKHYWGSLKNINPTGIIPVIPELDYEEAHDRDRMRNDSTL